MFKYFLDIEPFRMTKKSGIFSKNYHAFQISAPEARQGETNISHDPFSFVDWPIRRFSDNYFPG